MRVMVWRISNLDEASDAVGERFTDCGSVKENLRDDEAFGGRARGDGGKGDRNGADSEEPVADASAEKSTEDAEDESEKENAEDTEDESEVVLIEESSQEDTEGDTEENTETGTGDPTASLQGISGAVKGFGLGLLLSAIVAAAVVMILRRRKSGMAAPKAPGIPMELTLYSGRCLTDPRRLELRDGLLLGSSDRCDVRFEGAGVEPEHARIVIQNGQTYIEDLGSVSGVTVGGMRIQDRNPLRSGYVIGLGEVEFLLKY